MRLAIPTLILAVILVLGWRVCSGGGDDDLRLTEAELPAELRDSSPQAEEPVRPAQPSEESISDAAATETAAEVAAATPQREPEAAPQAAARAVAEPSPTPATTRADATAELAAVEPARESGAPPDISPPSLPAVSSPKAPVAGSERVYVVQPGDWLMKIARDQYGDAARAKDIARANGLSDADQVRPGQKLILP